jgi:hypothetical protein
LGSGFEIIQCGLADFRGLRVRLVPPLRDYGGIKADGGADEPARDDVRLRLALNRLFKFCHPLAKRLLSKEE